MDVGARPKVRGLYCKPSTCPVPPPRAVKGVCWAAAAAKSRAAVGMARPARCRSPPEAGGDYTHVFFCISGLCLNGMAFPKFRHPIGPLFQCWRRQPPLRPIACVRMTDSRAPAGRPVPSHQQRVQRPPPSSAAGRSCSPSLLPEICDRVMQGGRAAGARVHLWTEMGASASPPPAPIECWHLIGPRIESCRLQLPPPRPAARAPRAALDPGCPPGPPGSRRGTRPPPEKAGSIHRLRSSLPLLRPMAAALARIRGWGAGRALSNLVPPPPSAPVATGRRPIALHLPRPRRRMPVRLPPAAVAAAIPMLPPPPDFAVQLLTLPPPLPTASLPL